MKISKFALIASVALGLGTISCTSTKNKNMEGSSARETTYEKPAGLQLNNVYFDFNKYNVRPSERERVAHMAASLKNHSDTRVQIQGHTDDRGSTEYNLALGQRRADAVKKDLVAQGVNSDRISTMSFGKERPAVTGEGEEVWEKNRRAEVVCKENC